MPIEAMIWDDVEGLKRCLEHMKKKYPIYCQMFAKKLDKLEMRIAELKMIPRERV